MKKNNILSNTGSISSVLQLILTFLPSAPLWFTKVRTRLVIFIGENAKLTIWIIVLLLCLSIWLMIRLIRIKRHVKKDSLHYETADTSPTPFILIVDNDQNILDAFEEKDFKTLYPNTTLSLSLPDVNMTRGFDIIISDIAGAGYNQRNALNILVLIKEKYPSKMVYAMSSHTSFQNKTKELDGFVFKDKKNEYIDQIIQEIKKYWSSKGIG